MSELEATLARNTENVLRADLVYLGDEVAAARRTILAAYNNSTYWTEPIGVNVWRAVKDKHLSARGFHGPRSYIAEAYEAIKEAEDLRLMHEADPDVMHEVDRHELRLVLDRIVVGENALTGYLNDMDSA